MDIFQSLEGETIFRSLIVVERLVDFDVEACEIMHLYDQRAESRWLQAQLFETPRSEVTAERSEGGEDVWC